MSLIPTETATVSDESIQRIVDVLRSKRSDPMWFVHVTKVMLEVAPNAFMTRDMLDQHGKHIHAVRDHMRYRDNEYLYDNPSKYEISGDGSMAPTMHSTLVRGTLSIPKLRKRSVLVHVQCSPFADPYSHPPLAFRLNLSTKRLTLIARTPDPTKKPTTVRETQNTLGEPLACLDDLTIVKLFTVFTGTTWTVGDKVREHLCWHAPEKLIPFHEFVVRECKSFKLDLKTSNKRKRSAGTHTLSASGPAPTGVQDDTTIRRTRLP